MRDRIYTSFLEQQLDEGLALTRESDLIELDYRGDLPQRYRVSFRCKGLVKTSAGVEEADHFEVGVRFPLDYLRRAVPTQVLTWLGPRNVFHPNISNRVPFICVGRLAPGTPLSDLLYQCFELISWQKIKLDDALNEEACAWARGHRDRLPVDRRPLKRRRLTGMTVARGEGRQ